MVGTVPSGFTLAGVLLTGVALAGVAFVGVAFVTVEDTAVVVFFTGVAPVVLLTALAG